MANGSDHIEDLISRCLAGEADAAEIARLEAWRGQSPDNESHFALSRKLFDAVRDNQSDQSFNVEAAWNKLEHRISKEEASVIPLYKRYSVARMAAALLLLATLGIIARWAFSSHEAAPVVMVADNSTSAQQLPDGSKVFLNRHSELSYTVRDGKREVKLKGEAFFEVLHNEEQPFVIQVNDVLIKDIGTAFNVKALPGSNTVEVLVESGEVQFYSANNAGLSLVKGEKAVYDKTTREFIRLTVPAADNTMSYRSRVFHFNNATLQEVIEAVNAVYESDIQLADKKLGGCRLSVDFNNESVDVIVSIVAETLDLEVERRSSTTLLKGSACPE